MGDSARVRVALAPLHPRAGHAEPDAPARARARARTLSCAHADGQLARCVWPGGSDNFEISQPNKTGLIRPYSKREVTFVFKPIMSGPFQERLTVENVLDVGDDQVVLVKAFVLKLSTFYVDTLQLRFQPCLVDEIMPGPTRLVITNTSRHPRHFEVAVDRASLHFDVCDMELGFELEDVHGNRSVSREVAERIEALEQKVKIARRKVRKKEGPASLAALGREGGGGARTVSLTGRATAAGGARAAGCCVTSVSGWLPARARCFPILDLPTLVSHLPLGYPPDLGMCRATRSASRP